MTQIAPPPARPNPMAGLSAPVPPPQPVAPPQQQVTQTAPPQYVTGTNQSIQAPRPTGDVPQVTQSAPQAPQGDPSMAGLQAAVSGQAAPQAPNGDVRGQLVAGMLGQSADGIPAALPPAPKRRRGSGKGTRSKKPQYPGLWITQEDGSKLPVKLKEIPADYDADKYAPLKNENVENGSVLLRWKADECERQAAKLQADAVAYRAQAETMAKLGSSADQAKVKKLLDMQKRLRDLEAQLAAEGHDMDAIHAASEGFLK